MLTLKPDNGRARTDETTYVVQGWRQGNGTLWQPNQRVIVFDPVCGFDNTELLVSEVTFTQDQNGTLTEIRVGPPDAYLPEPEAPARGKRKKPEYRRTRSDEYD
ncbi:putative phage tail protein [Escherichia coli]|uniref:Putative phage tail protein n=1 Tax=Escherichia coli TaxID=562 RepID=A0A484YW40_ECOLX|nr:putative phage tail protein [Escherichia coli]